MALPPGIDPRTPVIVGAAQFLDAVGGVEPTALAAEAVRRAETDSGRGGLAARADIVAVVPIVSWRYYDPAALISTDLGASPGMRWYPSMGGNSPQRLVTRAAAAIAGGDADIAVVCGAESYRSRSADRKAGIRPNWTIQDDGAKPTWGDAQKLDMGHPAEIAHGIFLPTQCYPLFENALRHAAGHTAEEHSRFIAELWAGFSAVAATNPHALDRVGHSAEEIRTVTPTNRMIGFPYTKHMVSNPDLDAASAVIITSAATADSAGIARDRWVFIWSGTDGSDPLMSERTDFVSSAAMRVAGGAALELAGLSAAEVTHLDVYSCFPSAVEIACAELGIDTDRQLTVGGGLCFAGGPWNNPVGHALATMVDVLRSDPGSTGLVTANGGIIQKHAFGVYSTEPPPDGFRHVAPQFAIDSAGPAVSVVDDYDGPVTIETWTVMYERDGSRARAHAAVRTPDGARCWGTIDEDGVMADLEVEDIVGSQAARSTAGSLTI